MDDIKGPKYSLLHMVPSSIELLHLLLNWQGPEDLRSIRETFFAQLDRIVADKHMSRPEQLQSCQMALEDMNAAVNEELGKARRYQGVPINQSPSSTRHGGDITPEISWLESRAESDVNVQESVPAPISPPPISPETNVTTTFAISKEENDCFRALFKTIVTTPRKMRRVVNVWVVKVSRVWCPRGSSHLVSTVAIVIRSPLAGFDKNWLRRYLSCILNTKINAIYNVNCLGPKVLSPTLAGRANGGHEHATQGTGDVDHSRWVLVRMAVSIVNIYQSM